MLKNFHLHRTVSLAARKVLRRKLFYDRFTIKKQNKLFVIQMNLNFIYEMISSLSVLIIFFLTNKHRITVKIRSGALDSGTIRFCYLIKNVFYQYMGKRWKTTLFKFTVITTDWHKINLNKVQLIHSFKQFQNWKK